MTTKTAKMLILKNGMAKNNDDVCNYVTCDDRLLKILPNLFLAKIEVRNNGHNSFSCSGSSNLTQFSTKLSTLLKKISTKKNVQG